MTPFDWLFALPVYSCGLRMCDQTIRVAVGLRLGRKTFAKRTLVLVVHWWAPGVFTACLVRGVLGHLLAINRSTILFGGPSNAVLFRPPKNHRGYLEMTGNVHGWPCVSFMAERSVSHMRYHGGGLICTIVPFSNFFASMFGSRSSSRT